tara:strand:+ start:266 stop:589 length:324 start_codon:yes stop_codon:yes gene_type:complete
MEVKIMLHNIQKSLTACKKLQKSDVYGDKVSVFEELNFLRQIIKDTEALKKNLEAYAVEMEYAHMATVDRNHAPNLKAFQQIAKEHGFDANDYIINKPYQKFTWGNK